MPASLFVHGFWVGCLIGFQDLAFCHCELIFAPHILKIAIGIKLSGLQQFCVFGGKKRNVPC